MTGNGFDYLEKDLFNLRSLDWQYLEKLDLSNCKIIGIHEKAFIGLPKLEELILSRNKLSFRGRPAKSGEKEEPGRRIWPTENFLQPIASTLKVLDLSDAFDKNERQESPTAFVANLTDLFNKTDLKLLQYLNLSSNHITHLSSDLFCRAPVIEYLYLSTNRLHTFSAEDGCLPSLMELHLRSNYIRRVDDRFMDLIDSRSFLSKVYLADNPFTCDCDAQKFIRWARTSSKLVDKTQYVCTRAKPREYSDQALISVPEEKLRCTSDASEYLHGVYILCAIAFVGLIALLVCIMYTNRGILCRRSLRSWMPLGGYQTLGREPEVKAEMV